MRSNILTKIGLLLFVVVLFLSGCLQRKQKKEEEEQQILNYIETLGLPFVKASKGYFYYFAYDGYGNLLSDGDTVLMVYSGYNLDNESYFVKNDTAKLVVGDPALSPVWNDLLVKARQGSVGILIIPYYLALGNHSLQGIPSNSTLVFYFRLLSDKALVNQTALFYEYIMLHYSDFQDVTANNVYIKKIFDGIGLPAVNLDSIIIAYETQTLEDTTVIDESERYFVVLDDALPGLADGLLFLYDGDKAQLFIPPEMGYGENPPFDIPPFSPLKITVRLLSSDPDVAEDSNIKEFFYTHDISDADTLENGIIIVKLQTDENQPLPSFNDTLNITYFAKVINSPVKYEFCDECNRVLNSETFLPALAQAIKENLHKSEEAYFIIPYELAYGSEGTSTIPPYATILYYIKLNDIYFKQR